MCDFASVPRSQGATPLHPDKNSKQKKAPILTGAKEFFSNIELFFSQ
jgi:hypothetical protein